MAVEQQKVTDRVRADAEVPLAARGDGAANTNVRNYTLGLGSAVVQLPTGWDGCMLRLTPRGGNLAYLFSTSAAQTVDYTQSLPAAAAADGNPGVDRGGLVLANTTREVFVPEGFVYFARMGDTAATCVIVEKG